MTRITGIREWLKDLPVLRFGLIRHDVEAGDRQWFALCRVRHFQLFPWVLSDWSRTAIALWLARDVTPPVLCTAIALLALGNLFELWFDRRLRRPGKDHLRRLTVLRRFLVGRALVWSAAIGVLLAFCPSHALGVLAFFAATTLIYDMLCMISVPVIGVAACAIATVGIGTGLLVHPQIGAIDVAVVALMSIGGSHFCVFNLHYLFATRRLRTRKLQTANQTVQVLLAQYDEHGSDWLIEVDAAGRLVDPTAKLCKALGRPREQLEGVPIARVLGGGAHVHAMLAAVRGAGRFHDCLVPVTIAGRLRWWSISGLAIHDADGSSRGFRGFVRDVTERHEAEERMRQMATCDALTGLANRTVFKARVEAELQQGIPQSAPQACRGVLSIDLDSFTEINDMFGHHAGDAVLIEITRRIQAELEPGEFAGRTGGDEFAILLGVDDALDAELRAGRIAERLAEPITTEGRVIVGGGSIGIALYPDHARDTDSLLRAADMALFEAKSAGRGRRVLYDAELEHRLSERRSLEADLRQALANGELDVFYQPFHDIATRRTTGCEALLRWRHPTRGMIPPTVFIPIAEASGMIVAIGEWVLREALTEAARWPEEMTIAVNVSPAQMHGDTLARQVVHALAISGVAPRRLELEITETLLIHDSESHRRLLHELRSIGVRIALDDFGTGYSSLNYLRSFPFDKLKIDRSFVMDLAQNADCRAIVATVVALARRFRMQTIAEGVEDEAQLAILAELGCESVQGFLFSEAVPAGELEFGSTAPDRPRRAG